MAITFSSRSTPRSANLRWLASTPSWLGLRLIRPEDGLTCPLRLNRSQSALGVLGTGGDLDRYFDLFFGIGQTPLSRQDQGEIDPSLNVSGIVLRGLTKHPLGFGMTSLLPA